METEPSLLSSRLFLKSSACEVNLSRVLLTWRELRTRTTSDPGHHEGDREVESHSVSVSEIIATWEKKSTTQTKNDTGYTQEQNEACQSAFTVSYVAREGQHRWRPCDMTFHCPDSATCQQWIHTIKGQLFMLTHRPKCLLVYINPFGGKRKAKSIYYQRVAPLFSCASVSTDVIETKRRDHARDHLANDADLTKYDGVVCVGGDGMFSEVLHGLLTRTQSDAGVDQNSPGQKLVPCGIRVGIIPAGSTDCVCYATVGINDPVTSALHIIVGDSHALDVCSIHNENTFLRYSVSLLGYGFYGDVQMDSEKKRWMGPARYSFSGFTTFLAHHCYEGSVHFLPATDISGSPKDKTRCRAGCPLCQQAIQEPSNGRCFLKRDKEIPDKEKHHRWQVIQGKFLAINAASMSCACSRSPEGLSPSAHLADGTTDLILVHDCSRLNFFKHLIRHINKHDQFDLGFVEVHRVRQFRFVPGHFENDPNPDPKETSAKASSLSCMSHPTLSKWSCDGEILNDVAIEVGVHQGLIQLFARGIEV